MSKSNYVLSIDAGGTFFKSCIVSSEGTIVTGSQHKASVDSAGSADAIFFTYTYIITKAFIFAGITGIKIDGIAISTPGPFDYKNHKSLMTHKFHEIYNISIKDEICRRCELPDSFPIEFVQDAHAFLLGEHWCGAAQGYANAAGVTIGTGLGLGIMKNNLILDNGKGGPSVVLFNQPWQGGILEDVVSKRGIISIYNKLSGNSNDIDVINIAQLARVKAVTHAIDTFTQVGQALGTSLRPILMDAEIECIVFGGQIARAFDLMEFSLKDSLANIDCLKAVSMAQNIDYSALIGASQIIFGGQ